MDQARYSCSISNTRAIACGKVKSDKRILYEVWPHIRQIVPPGEVFQFTLREGQRIDGHLFGEKGATISIDCFMDGGTTLTVGDGSDYKVPDGAVEDCIDLP